MVELDDLINVEQLILLSKDTNPTMLFCHMNMPINSQQQNTVDGYIPNSILFDFETDITDKNHSAPHMLPSVDYFAKRLTQMGINNDSSVVIYDDQGMFSAPRAWWMLKSLGHEKVYVLNGGLQAWIDAKQMLDTKLATSSPSVHAYMPPTTGYQYLVNKQQLLSNLDDNKLLILDARSPNRFFGLEPEPRVGVRAGHIPGAKNLYYASLLVDGHLASKATLQSLFSKLDKNIINKQLVFSCGSGVTASILALAANQIGISNWSVYDGSWSEWGADKSCPIVLQD
jgi:thiosulfate/3-mercaptopyruvate sulfurtransferase